MSRWVKSHLSINPPKKQISGPRICTFRIQNNSANHISNQEVIVSNPPPPPPPPRFHWTAIPLRSWRSRIFSKIIPNRRGSVDSHTLPVRFQYASTTLPFRCCYDPTTTMKIWLRLVYADGDVAATLAMELRFRCALISFLYGIWNSDTLRLRPRRFYCASTTLLLRSCRFCYDTSYFES